MKILLIHQHDPTAGHVGGIGSFINTSLKGAPPDIEIDFIGVSQDPSKYPIGRWHDVELGNRNFRFLPVVAADPVLRKWIPLTLQLTWALHRYRSLIPFDQAILMFHRIEPALAFQNLSHPKILFIHGHMNDLYHPLTEVKWKKFPWLYFVLERRLISGMEKVYLCREDAVPFYRDRYPALGERIGFLPELVDEEIFHSLPENERRRLRRELTQPLGLPPESHILLFAGRFEGQKDPLLLLEAFRRVGEKPNGREILLLIGAGGQEASMRSFVERQGLSRKVKFLGPKSQPEIVSWMNVSDCLCLSSAYEGMPIVVLEALCCGLPVVSTDTGEIKRMIQNPQVGRVVPHGNPGALAAAFVDLLSQPPDREACIQSAAPYTSGKVLKRVWEDCRRISKDRFRP